MEKKDARLEIIQRGRDYLDLKARPGYERLLAFLENHAVSASMAVLQNMSDDPNVKLGLQNRWVERERFLQIVRNEVENGIAEMQAVLQEAKEIWNVEEEIEFDDQAIMSGGRSWQ